MNAFTRTALKTVAGSGVIATALVVFTGAPAQAIPLASCDGVTTIPATEDALRTAIAGTDAVICIDAGTIDFSNGVDLTDGPIDIARDVTIIGVGAVTFDGGNQSKLLTTTGGIPFAVTVQNLTFQNAFTDDSAAVGNAIEFRSAGTLTVLNSTFLGNGSYGGYGAAIASRSSFSSSAGDQGAIVVDNSLFSGNGSASHTSNGGAVFAYGDLTVTNSTFLTNSTGSRGGAITANATTTVQSNLFVGNAAANGGAIDLTGFSLAADVSNNTFFGNTASNTGGAVAVDRDTNFADNTFVDNEAGVSGDAIYKGSAVVVGLFGNILAASVVGPTVGELGGPDLAGTDTPYTDFGANISTFAADAAQLTTSALTPGQVGADYATLGLSPLADNGGPTQTMALNAGSIAIGAATPAIRAAATGITQPSVDQRGVSRGDASVASSAGAYEFGATVPPVIDPAELAKTGFGTASDSTASIALAGAALLGGAALVTGATLTARRRREHTAA
jgi:hypothetical protein